MIRVKQIEIGIKSLGEFLDEAARDMKLISERKFMGKKEGLYFESINAANRFLTPQRIALLKAIKKHSPDSLYELAKLTNRPLKSINRDIAVLKEDGLIEVRQVIKGRKRTIPVVDYDKISIGIEI